MGIFAHFFLEIWDTVQTHLKRYGIPETPFPDPHELPSPGNEVLNDSLSAIDVVRFKGFVLMVIILFAVKVGRKMGTILI